MQSTVWLGTATLRLSDANPQRQEGYIGGFAVFACRADDLIEAVRALQAEFAESAFILVGIEKMLPADMLDREPTSCESALLDATTTYPVQFKNVHLHKTDG